MSSLKQNFNQISSNILSTLVITLIEPTVMLFSFFGFTNPIFLSIAVFLGLSIFFQASFKEHISHEMLSSMKFYFGRTEDTAVIMSTTELLYVLSALFFFGFFTVLEINSNSHQCQTGELISASDMVFSCGEMRGLYLKF